eukprot:NODE_51_length_27121_cov_0.309452.p6 type:complete len:281 gc:universal NODE_51_length_27121_cov_0.309452:18360-17518(-)
MNFFKTKLKTPQESVKALRESITNSKFEESNKILNQLKSSEDEQLLQVLQELIASDTLYLTLLHMNFFEFEAKKDLVYLISMLMRKHANTLTDYLVDRESKQPQLLSYWIGNYGNADVALNCGMLLRECIRYQGLASIILENKSLLDQFFQLVELPTFDISSDAFATFKELLTKHPVDEYLERNYDYFFERYTSLLNSQNYVTKRQSLKLLGELLLDKQNYSIMMKYIANVDNLKLLMNLLRDKSKNIQYEAFHVFKVVTNLCRYLLQTQIKQNKLKRFC